jgi:L-rhamnose mutarotase
MRHVFLGTVKDGRMDEYLHHHDNIWPEVAAGLRVAGVTHLHIWRLGDSNTLVMTIETNGTDLEEATGNGSLYRSDPRCDEWETLMDNMFAGGWIELSGIHASDKHWNHALALPPSKQSFDARPSALTKGLLGGQPPATTATPAAPEAKGRAHRRADLAAGVAVGLLLATVVGRVLARA